jgi:hypothetical protein
MPKLLPAMSRAVLLALVLLAGTSASGAAQSQLLQRDELTRYARAHLAMGVARDEFHRRIAGIHDDLGLARAREEMNIRIAQILEENAMTSERYGEITLLISQDEAIRATFDEISAQLRASEPG